MTREMLYKIAFASVRGVDLARKMLEVIGEEQEFFRISEMALREITGSKSKILSKSYRNDCLIKAQN